MKITLPLLFALVSLSAFAQTPVAKISPCSPALKKLAKNHCRVAGPSALSIWDAQTSKLHVEENGKITELDVPMEQFKKSLALQLTVTIDEVFYHAAEKEWVIFNYSTMFERNAVVLIQENQIGNHALVTELYSHTNDIHLNTTFDAGKIRVESDDRKKSILVERDSRSVQEFITEGMVEMLKNPNLPDADLYQTSVRIHDKCLNDSKCEEKEKKAIRKEMQKHYKKIGNKEAVQYLKIYGPFGYPLNRVKELRDGCLFVPNSCGDIIESDHAYYRLNINVDNGARAISFNHFMPSGFSVLDTYVPVSPLTK